MKSVKTELTPTPALPFRYPDDLKISLDSDPKMKYDGSKPFYLNVHYGQVKLFSNELEFLLSYVFEPGPSGPSGPQGKKKIVLYIGAGNTGEHLVTLSKMFPTVEWHLFDKCFDAKLQKCKNVLLELRYFDDESMEKYREISANPDVELYMISDIRNLSYDSKNYSLKEALTSLEDMKLQRKWTETILPVYTMLKFKLPHNEKEVTDHLGPVLEYLPGTLYKQPWAKGKSIETRLIISGDQIASGDNSKEYSIQDFEQVLFYHNAVTRQKEYQFPFSEELDGTIISPQLKLNKRYDTAFIVTILVEYFNRMGGSDSDEEIKRKVLSVLKMIGHRDPKQKLIKA